MLGVSRRALVTPGSGACAADNSRVHRFSKPMWLIKVRAGTVRVSRSATGPPIPSTARSTVSASEAGLDQYQVRGYRAWYAHITLAMLAAAYLAATRAQEAEEGGSGPGGNAGGSGLAMSQ